MAVERKRYITYSLLWGAIAAVVLWANSSAKEHREQQPITDFEIVVSDVGADALIDEEYIDSWLVLHDMHPEGRVMSGVDLARLEEVIAEHSAVSAVNAYMTYDGCLTLNVAQRRAVARLRIDGYDMYLSADGYLLPVTDCRLLQLPVITGDYKPLFDASYSGYHGDSSNEPMAEIERRFRSIDERRVDLLKERVAINAKLRGVEKEGVKRELFSSDEAYRGRVEALKERKMAARRKHAERDREIELALRALEDERLAASLEADRVRSMVRDFGQLIAFIDYLRREPFWRAEVVQVVLSKGSDGAMEIAIVPRSGGFIVDMGFAENLVAKLGTLRYFYDRALSNVGWDKYKHISLRYNDQVVCR